jgi:hypothetical protein
MEMEPTGPLPRLAGLLPAREEVELLKRSIASRLLPRKKEVRITEFFIFTYVFSKDRYHLNQAQKFRMPAFALLQQNKAGGKHFLPPVAFLSNNALALLGSEGGSYDQ